MPTQRAVAGFDGSMTAVAALDRAAQEAHVRRAVLEIVYAVPVLDEAAHRVHCRHPGLPVTALAVVGDPVRALVRSGENAALTVVGRRAAGPLARLLRRSRCPVVIVPGAPRRWPAAWGRSAAVCRADDDARSSP